jgi:Rap1a immunity proteins
MQISRWHQLAWGSLVAAVVATSAAAHFDTGDELYELCTLKEAIFRDMGCAAIASAYLDMMRTLGYSCEIDDDVKRIDIADVLRKYLGDHKEDRQKNASSLAVEAFTQAFHCSPPGHR